VHLGLAHRVVTKVVQATFTDRDDLGVIGQPADPVLVPAREVIRVVGVDTNRGIDLLELVSQLDGPLARCPPTSDGDDTLDAGLDGLLDQVRGRLLARGQMGVGVDDGP
jgi:hypothetical protein